MRRFPCPELPAEGEQTALDAEVSHHLLRVTRVPRGGRVELYDGTGQIGVGVLVDVEGAHAIVRIEQRSQVGPALAPLWACLAVTKGSRFEVAVRMAVELGATEVVPVLAKRSVAKGDRHDRWQRVVDGAVRQSGQSHTPTLHALTPLPRLLAGDLLASVAVRWICVPSGPLTPGTSADGAVLVGPEGGWTPGEVDAATAAGWSGVGLGPTVLRAETAVAAALTRLRCEGPASLGA